MLQRDKKEENRVYSAELLEAQIMFELYLYRFYLLFYFILFLLFLSIYLFFNCCCCCFFFIIIIINRKVWTQGNSALSKVLETQEHQQQ